MSSGVTNVSSCGGTLTIPSCVPCLSPSPPARVPLRPPFEPSTCRHSNRGSQAGVSRKHSVESQWLQGSQAEHASLSPSWHGRRQQLWQGSHHSLICALPLSMSSSEGPFEADSLAVHLQQQQGQLHCHVRAFRASRAERL